MHRAMASVVYRHFQFGRRVHRRVLRLRVPRRVLGRRVHRRVLRLRVLARIHVCPVDGHTDENCQKNNTCPKSNT